MFENIEFPEKGTLLNSKMALPSMRSTLISKCKHRRASKVGYRKRKNLQTGTHFYGNIATMKWIVCLIQSMLNMLKKRSMVFAFLS